MEFLHILTPTLVDLRELFTLGLTSKAGGEKIGHKGSGLKFTLALLHRLGSSLTVRIGDRTLRSVVCNEVVRDTAHDFLFLEEGAGRIATHITANAGSDTWSEPWFALRELVQNAMDEGGSYFTSDGDPVQPPGSTVMSIELTAALSDAWDRRHEWLNVRHPEIIYRSDCPGLYYHGFRILERAEWLFSYDVTTILRRDQLSEDRQLRNADYGEMFRAILEKCPELPPVIYDFLTVAEAPANEDVKSLLDAVYSGMRHDVDQCGGFRLSILERKLCEMHGEKIAFTHEGGAEGSEAYFAKAAGYAVVELNHKAIRILGYSRKLVRTCNVLPEVKNRLTAAKVVATDSVTRLKTALSRTRKLRPDGCKVRVVQTIFEGDQLGACAFANVEGNEVLLLKPHVEESDVDALTNTLIEEYVHLSSGAGDGSIRFEKALIKVIQDLITPRVRKRAAEESLTF